jgi:hypothetical protein
MFYGEFNSTSKMLRYINAGHCQPILITNEGEASRLPEAIYRLVFFPKQSIRNIGSVCQKAHPSSFVVTV